MEENTLYEAILVQEKQRDDEIERNYRHFLESTDGEASCEEVKDALYFAVTSNSLDNIDRVVNKCQNAETLSAAYKYLYLTNVPRSFEAENYIVNRLISLQDRVPIKVPVPRPSLQPILERISAVLRACEILLDSSNSEINDPFFIHTATFLARNLHILKRQLKSTFVRIPWEEMEFCLIIFIYSSTKSDPNNMFYQTVLNKQNMLKYIAHFKECLIEEKKVIEENVNSINLIKKVPMKEKETNKVMKQLSNGPGKDRSKIVGQFIREDTPFKTLCQDFKRVKDVYSLYNVSEKIKLALSVDPDDSDGKLIIIRCLQSIGENLKNTNDSPNLSDEMLAHLVNAAPTEMINILTKLRLFLSHPFSLFGRTRLEENVEVDYFVRVQNDLRKVHNVISDVQRKNKEKMFGLFLNHFQKCANLKEAAYFGHQFDPQCLFPDWTEQTNEYDKVLELVDEFSAEFCERVGGSADQNIELVISILKEQQQKSIKLISFQDEVLKHVLSCVLSVLDCQPNNKYVLNLLKILAVKYNEESSIKVQKEMLNKKIVDLLDNVLIKTCHRYPKLEEIHSRIAYILEVELHSISKIGDVKDILNESEKIDKTLKSESEYRELLIKKVGDLRKILETNEGKCYSIDMKLQALVESLLLDILTIMHDKLKYLDENLSCIENYPFTLYGRNLRNYLAHGNPLIDILSIDINNNIFFNAKLLSFFSDEDEFKKYGRAAPLFITNNEDFDTMRRQILLFKALKTGDANSMADCLAKGANIRGRGANGQGALHAACHSETPAPIQFVLDRGIPFTDTDSTGQSALHVASKNNNHSILMYLLQKDPSSVYFDDAQGRNPLHIATIFGNVTVVELLLKFNADIEKQDKMGTPPVLSAMFMQHLDILKIFIEEMKKDGDWCSRISLHAAVQVGNIDIVKLLLDNGASCDRVIPGILFTPLHFAVQTEFNEDIVDLLLSSGANPEASDFMDRTPLYYATDSGNVEIVKTLLKNFKNINKKEVFRSFTVLHEAVNNGVIDVVKELLRHKAIDINPKSDLMDTPLHIAALQNNPLAVQILVSKGAKVNERNYSGSTPLHTCATFGYSEAASILIDTPSSVLDLPDDFGYTPLHLAAKFGYKDIVEMLLAKGVPVNILGENDITPLHQAAIFEHTEIVKVLLSHGANVNALSKGFKPLSLCVTKTYKNIDICKLLIDNGTIIDMKIIAVTFSCDEHRISEMIIEKIGDVQNYICDKGYSLLQCAIVLKNASAVKQLLEKGMSPTASTKDIWETPIHFALKTKQPEILDILLEHNKSQIEISFAFMEAVEENYFTIYEKLFHKYAQYMEEQTIIFLFCMAVYNGRREIMNCFIPYHIDCKHLFYVDDFMHPESSLSLFHKINPNVRLVSLRKMIIFNSTGGKLTALYVAASCGHTEIVQDLLMHEAPVDLGQEGGSTPLQEAVVKGHNEVVSNLLLYGAKYEEEILFDIVAKKKASILKTFIGRTQIDINTIMDDVGVCLLQIAAYIGHFDTTKVLIDNGANVDRGHGELVMEEDELFAYIQLVGNDILQVGMTPLQLAALQGHTEIVRMLIENHADVDKSGCFLRPIELAIHRGHKDVVVILLDNGASCQTSVISSNEDLQALLHCTQKMLEIAKEDCDAINELIKEGVPVNAKNVEGQAVIHIIAGKCLSATINLLLEHKVNLNSKDNKGNTALHYACMENNYEVVRTLLIHGAYFDETNNCDNTPEKFATDPCILELMEKVNKYFNSVQYGQRISIDNESLELDDAKVIVNAKNKQRQTLTVYATLNDHPDVEDLKRIVTKDLEAALLQEMEEMTAIGNFDGALEMLDIIIQQRKEVFHEADPAVLDLLLLRSELMYEKGEYEEAFLLLGKLHLELYCRLGSNNKTTIKSKHYLIKTLTRHDKERSLHMAEEFYNEISELFGADHIFTYNSEHVWGDALIQNGQLTNAFKILNKLYKRMEKSKEHRNSKESIDVKASLGEILHKQGRSGECLQTFKEIYESSKICLGESHYKTERYMKMINLIDNEINTSNISSAQIWSECLNIISGVVDIERDNVSKVKTLFASVMSKMSRRETGTMRCADMKSSIDFPWTKMMENSLVMINRLMKK